MNEGRFDLKPEYLLLFDPFFPKFSDSERNKAEHQYFEKLKSLSTLEKEKILGHREKGHPDSFDIYPPVQSAFELPRINHVFQGACNDRRRGAQPAGHTRQRDA